jgi:hypothetical protein
MIRVLLLALAGLVIFASAAVLMLRLMPGPLKDSDYLVIGSVATLVSILVVFLLLVSTTMKSKDVFFKRRKKQG